MSKFKFTDTVLGKLKAPKRTHASQTAYVLHSDAEMRGLRLRHMDSGKIYFFVQGRVNGKEVRHAIGCYDTMSIAVARQRAADLRGSMADGVNPIIEKVKAQAIPTLHELAQTYVRLPGKNRKASTIEAIERIVATCCAKVKNDRVSTITETWVRKRYDELAEGGLHGDLKTGSPASAIQFLAVLKALFNFAIEEKHINANPCLGIGKHRKVKLKPRTEYVKADRIGAVWAWLADQRAGATTLGAQNRYDFARFLLWTGARIGEVEPLTWDRVDLDAGSWHLPDPKNREPITLPLCSQAVDMLNERKELCGRSKWIFPGVRATHFTNPSRVDLWEPLSKVAAEQVSAHSMRRTFTTLALKELNLDFVKVELLTGHKMSGSVTLHHYTDTRDLTAWAAEVQKVADYYDQQALRARSGVADLDKARQRKNRPLR